MGVDSFKRFNARSQIGPTTRSLRRCMGGGENFAPVDFPMLSRRVAMRLALLALLSGCAAAPTLREAFYQADPGLSSPQRDILLETLEIVSLLEDYLGVLETRDGEKFFGLLSENFSYYEHDRSWFRDKTERELFRPYSAIRATANGIRIVLVKKGAASWIRQEGFDWLNGPAGERTLPRSYLISARGGEPFSVLLAPAAGYPSPEKITALAVDDSGRGMSPPEMGRSVKVPRACPGGLHSPGCLRGSPPGGIETENVTVEFRGDASVSEMLGEVSFRLTLAGRRERGGEITLAETVVLLLEKERAEWKIVSIE